MNNIHILSLMFFTDSTIMILDGDYKYASTEIITGPGFGSSEIESTIIDSSDNSNRRKRGLIQNRRHTRLK